MHNTEQRQARALNQLETLQQVATAVTTVFSELQRIHDSEELADILRKGQSAIRIVTDAAEDAADEVQDIVLLALQIYDKSISRGRALTMPRAIGIDQIATRDELIDQVVIRLHRPQQDFDPAA